MKLTEKEKSAFDTIGGAIVAAKCAAKVKKNAVSDIKNVLAANKESFAAGVKIGNYKFQTIERVELSIVSKTDTQIVYDGCGLTAGGMRSTTSLVPA